MSFYIYGDDAEDGGIQYRMNEQRLYPISVAQRVRARDVQVEKKKI